MEPLVIAAQRERDQLKKSLAQITARLAELDEFLRISSTLQTGTTTDHRYGSAHAVAGASASSIGLVAHVPVVLSSRVTIKDQVIRTCADLIASNAGPIRTKDLVQGLESRGIVLNQDDKVLQVSAILSRANDVFLANRKLGWSLVSAGKGEGPGGETPDPSDSRQLPLSTAVGATAPAVG